MSQASVFQSPYIKIRPKRVGAESAQQDPYVIFLLRATTACCVLTQLVRLF